LKNDVGDAVKGALVESGTELARLDGDLHHAIIVSAIIVSAIIVSAIREVCQRGALSAAVASLPPR
jgi:hypothetical protein